MKKEGEKLSDPSLWTELYGDYLYNFAFSRLFRKEIAEDLVQETFLSALKARKNFKGQSTEQTWLISILKNKIIDHFRKVSNTREKMILDNQWEISGQDSPFRQEAPFKGHWKNKDQSFSIEMLIEREEFQTILEDCIKRLPVKWANAFVLKIVEEAESDSVCKDLNISPSNLWVILHRARLKMRDCLEKKWMN